MTRKDYELIASILKTTKPNGPDFKDMETFIQARNKWEELVQDTKVRLKQKNSAFDSTKFLTASNY